MPRMTEQEKLAKFIREVLTIMFATWAVLALVVIGWMVWLAYS